MDYRGTDNDDVIDYKALAIPDGTTIWGGKGNDTITFAFGNVVGEAGNDTIRNTTKFGTAAYWSSPSGIHANLQTGVVSDGYGTTDTLIGFYSIADSGHDDTFIGSTRAERFWLGWGSNKVTGGGGNDTVMVQNLKLSEATVGYDIASRTFTIKKNSANGDTGTDLLTDVSVVWLTSENVLLTPDMFDHAGGFLRGRTFLPSFDMTKVGQLRAGDFNGDGKADILVVRANADNGITAEPLQVLIGDGKGNFTDGTAGVFSAGIPKVNYVPRIFTADFNKDGISDIFNPDFGVDAPPFPGGQNSLYLSDPATGKLVNATASLPQGLRQNHGTSIGDVNKDGYPDLLVNALNETTHNANQLLINDRTGHFTPALHLMPASVNVENWDHGNTWSMLRDLNNDGYADMVLGTWDNSPHPSRVFLNNGAGSFASAQPIVLPRAGLDKEIVVGIETIDLNGDALPDLILSVTNGGPNDAFYRMPYLQLLVNDGNGQFHDETALRLPQSKTANAPGTETTFYLSATPIDLNGDGFQDILADGAYGGVSTAYINNGSGGFTVGWTSTTGGQVVAADVNGDGKMDLVESTEVGFSVLMNAFPNRVPASGEYRAGDAGERIAGGAAKETIYSGKGNDTIDAGAGLDTVVYTGSRAQYTLAKADGGFTVTGLQGTDTLAQVERVKFSDVSLALDIDGVAGQAYRVYEAAFNRPADNGGLGYWIDTMDKGATLAQIAVGFVQSAEFQSKFAGKSNADIVNEFYSNILNRAGEPAGTAWWIEQLNAGNATLAEVLVGFSEAAENKANLVGITQNGIPFTPWG
jgi:hypothetical protein